MMLRPPVRFFIAEVVYGTLVIRRLVILGAVYPWRNFSHALWVDFQKKSCALLCSAVARDESTKPHTLKEFPTVSCLFPFLWRVVGVPPASSKIYRNIQ